MNKVITRDLKEYQFEFDNNLKLLHIISKRHNRIITMDKVRMASLARFLIRVLYSMSVKSRKSNVGMETNL